MPNKTVFISYSHDSDEHKAWVRKLASFLTSNGIKVILDQWDLRIGEDIPQFVEKSIIQSDRVLLICTEKYVEKARTRVGGVGLEALVINANLMKDLGSSKFIAVVRQQSTESIILPHLLESRLYVNLSDDNSFLAEADYLIKEIYDVVHLDKPPLGKNPFDNSNTYEIENEDLIEAGTMLDLSRAYIDMGDDEGAIDVLKEVLSTGNLIQQKEARELIMKIKHFNQ